jgi:hypothetical protein
MVVEKSGNGMVDLNALKADFERNLKYAMLAIASI